MENENKIKEEAIVVNEKDILNPEEVKEEEVIDVETSEVIIEEDKTEEDTKETEEENNIDVKEDNKEANETNKEANETNKEANETNKEANETNKEAEKVLVAKLNVYYDKLLKMDIKQGTVIKDIYENNKVKLNKKRIEELVNAGVAEYK